MRSSTWKTTWTQEICLIDSLVVAQLNKLYNMFKENKPEKVVTIQEETNEELVFCDASNLFWGAVFLKDEELQTITESWSLQEYDLHINEKEALALSRSIKMCKYKNPTFLSDSTVVVQACAKGHSKNVYINATVSTLKIRYPQSQVLWISTEQNPADAPSRNQELHHIRWDVIEPFDAKGKKASIMKSKISLSVKEEGKAKDKE